MAVEILALWARSESFRLCRLKCFLKSRWRSHESGEKPGPLAPDSPIQAISLLVLNEGHAALIYKVSNRNNFRMIYVSLKRRQVISFNSQNVVFEVYWLKNLKGFFRLTESMFVSDD